MAQSLLDMIIATFVRCKIDTIATKSTIFAVNIKNEKLTLCTVTTSFPKH